MSLPEPSRESLRTRFWRLAHSRYHARKPSGLVELAIFTWFGFWALVYGSAVLAGWRPSSLPEALMGVLLVGAPLTAGLVHRRIRIEAAKGRDALYLKWLETRR